MTPDINAQVDALNTLRALSFGAFVSTDEVINAINTLDNADLFAKLDEHMWNESSYEVL